MKRGVFWLIDGKLLVFPFDGSYPEGVAKSGNSYNHQKLRLHRSLRFWIRTGIRKRY